MAVSKLTHAKADTFMEQSFTDCLCNPGSTGTLASNTAPSSTFPTLLFQTTQPAGLASQCLQAALPNWAATRNTHRNMHHSSHLPTILPTSLPYTGTSRTNLSGLQSSSILSLPSRCLEVSQGHLNTKPLLTILLSEPAAGRGGKRTPTPDRSSVGTTGTLLLLLLTSTHLC